MNLYFDKGSNIKVVWKNIFIKLPLWANTPAIIAFFFLNEEKAVIQSANKIRSHPVVLNMEKAIVHPSVVSVSQHMSLNNGLQVK